MYLTVRSLDIVLFIHIRLDENQTGRIKRDGGRFLLYGNKIPDIRSMKGLMSINDGVCVGEEIKHLRYNPCRFY